MAGCGMSTSVAAASLAAGAVLVFTAVLAGGVMHSAPRPVPAGPINQQHVRACSDQRSLASDPQ
jgi:hypothetical protein